MGTRADFFSFVRKNILRSRMMWAFLAVFVVGGVLFFFPALFANHLVLDESALTEERLDQILLGFENGDLTKLQNSAPNLTQALTGMLVATITEGSEITDLNLAERKLEELVNSPEKVAELADKFASQVLTQQNLYFPDVAEDEQSLKLKGTDEKTDKLRYAQQFQEVLGSNFLGFKMADPVSLIEDALDHDDFSFFTDASSRLQKSYEGLLAIEVPLSLVDFHLLELKALRESQAVFEAWAGARNDPLRAVLGLVRYSTLAERKLEAENLLKAVLEELGPFEKTSS